MVINVSQLNNYIHGMLEIDGVLSDISVAGEVTNVKRAREGWYFSLKDDCAAIDCFCYGNGACAEPVAGALIVAEGKINFWVKSGRISFFVRKFSATDKSGAAYLRFLELKEKLQKEGLFDEIRKKAVPNCCAKIGVVTSATGAVIHDIETVALRRQPFSSILLYPVKVQGAGADAEIACGIEYFSSSDVDVVIVGRGGGSNEDLSPFNSEIVVRAVANCKKPVVSAVGHGVDFTLCDFAADKRAATPSEAAEFVTLDSAAVKSELLFRLNRLCYALNERFKNYRKACAYATNRISAQLSHNISDSQSAVRFLLSASSAKLQNRLEKAHAQTENVTARISAANPANVLRRGYAYVERDGARVHSVTQVRRGDVLCLTLADGSFSVVANDINLKNGE